MACYGHSDTFLYVSDVRVSQETSTVLHGPLWESNKKQTPWPLVRERTIPTEPPPLVDEI
jgi:hypothetical protein